MKLGEGPEELKVEFGTPFWKVKPSNCERVKLISQNVLSNTIL